MDTKNIQIKRRKNDGNLLPKTINIKWAVHSNQTKMSIIVLIDSIKIIII